MKYCINPDECKNFNIGTDTFLYLLALYFEKPINKDTIIEICKNGLVDIDGFDINQQFLNPRLNKQGLEIVEEILANSKMAGSKEESVTKLAVSLMDIFPEGKKPETNLYWKGNIRDITLKLKAFFTKYGNRFTDEQIIEAAKDYVKSFNGNYSRMRILKYFIYKDERRTGGEEFSDLASYIENFRQSDSNKNDIGELV